VVTGSQRHLGDPKRRRRGHTPRCTDIRAANEEEVDLADTDATDTDAEPAAELNHSAGWSIRVPVASEQRP
jgi:hypothetical protein